MTSPDPASRPGDDHPDADRRAADDAAVAYWRAVARERRVAAARVQRRPLVRAAVALDRRTARAQAALGARSRVAASALRSAAVRAAAVPHRSAVHHRRATIDQLLDQGPQRAEAVGVLVVHLGPAPAIPSGTEVELRAIDPTRADWADDADRAVAEATRATVVVLLGPSSRPLHDGWLSALVAGLGSGGATVATAPLVVHPARPWASATPHDLRVRALGLRVVVDDHGRPIPLAAGAGAAPDRAGAGSDVLAATGAAVAVRREAWLAAGGLAAPDGRRPRSLHPAVVDLCRRLRAGGGAIRTVPASVVEDADPVRSAADLRGPIAVDDPDWHRVVEAGGPMLLRLGRDRAAATPPSIALSTAVPSPKMAARSGDWLYAGLFAAALQRAGHPVRVQTADQADDLAGRVCDVHLVLRGLEPVRRTTGQVHVLWVISHPEALTTAECDDADLVLVASPRFAEHLRGLTTTPVEVLLQATEPRRFHPRPIDPAHHHPVTVVANAREIPRPAVADAVAADLRPAVYGAGWEPDPASRWHVGGYAPADLLPAVYASADLVLNDHWGTMRHWGFVSNRVFDVLATGTTVASDALPELTDLFGDRVPTWRGPDDLRRLVADLRADPEGTAARTAEARRLVLEGHTFDHRVAQVADALRAHGLAP